MGQGQEVSAIGTNVGKSFWKKKKLEKHCTIQSKIQTIYSL